MKHTVTPDYLRRIEAATKAAMVRAGRRITHATTFAIIQALIKHIRQLESRLAAALEALEYDARELEALAKSESQAQKPKPKSKPSRTRANDRR